MKILDAIEQLKSLKNHCETMTHEPDSDMWRDDVEALDAGIFALVLLDGRGHTTIGEE